MRRSSVMMLACALWACAPEATETREAALEAPGPRAPKTPNGVVIDPMAHLGPKTGGAEAKPEVHVRTPDWEAARAARRLPVAWTQALELEGVPLPVLLPGDEALVRGAKVTRGPHWYAASMSGDGHSVYVQGTRTTHSFGSVLLDERGDALTRAPYVISRSHQILTLGFERFGVGYHIDVECAQPMADKRCLETDYVLGLYEALGVAGGVR